MLINFTCHSIDAFQTGVVDADDKARDRIIKACTFVDPPTFLLLDPHGA